MPLLGTIRGRRLASGGQVPRPAPPAAPVRVVRGLVVMAAPHAFVPGIALKGRRVVPPNLPHPRGQVVGYKLPYKGGFVVNGRRILTGMTVLPPQHPPFGQVLTNKRTPYPGAVLQGRRILTPLLPHPRGQVLSNRLAPYAGSILKGKLILPPNLPHPRGQSVGRTIAFKSGSVVSGRRILTGMTVVLPRPPLGQFVGRSIGFKSGSVLAGRHVTITRLRVPKGQVLGRAIAFKSGTSLASRKIRFIPTVFPPKGPHGQVLRPNMFYVPGHIVQGRLILTGSSPIPPVITNIGMRVRFRLWAKDDWFQLRATGDNIQLKAIDDGEST
jgi:hypothetical protein